MTLHEAIQKVFNELNKPSLTASEIAVELNRKKYYTKKDKSLIKANQISARTKNYPEIFQKVGNLISIQNQIIKPKETNGKTNLKKLQQIKHESKDLTLLEKILMNEKNFKTCEESEFIIPSNPGVYCIRIKDSKKIPKIFSQELTIRKHNIIYLGIASQNLNKRFFNQELRAKGHGTFFRSIGAVLNFKPVKGSLKEKANKRNYKFSLSDEKKIIEWINQNLLINWIELNSNLDNFETELILRYKPILNISKNPYSIPTLSALRAECVRIANE